MRCQRCGAPITNSYANINGTIVCGNCARDLKVDDIFKRQASFIEQAFPMLGELTGGLMGGTGDLDFGNSKIKCPRCGTTLRELDSKGMLGCIECYNTYNETVLKNILKKQGSSEYIGRKPGEAASIEAPDINPVDELANEKPVAPKEETKPVKTSEAAPAEHTIDLDQFRNSDLKSFSDELIEAGMKEAAKSEDYQLAVKLRDELKSRKEGN